MLVLTRKAEESITIGNNITVSILEIKGNQVRLGVKAPKDIPVNRTEIYASILSENIKASQSPQDLDQFPDILNPGKKG